MSRFNLLDENWISVISNDNKSEDISLKELFYNTQNYRCLAGEMQTQNFAVMRFLLAVLVTVFTRVDADGNPYEWLELDDRMHPVNSLADEDTEEDDQAAYLKALDQTWLKLWNSGKFPDAVNEYLEKWRDHFYLLDDQYPFYQVTPEVMARNLKIAPGKSALSGSNTNGKQFNRLVSESGNKTALFSPMSTSWKNRMSAAELARWLIMLQGYYGTADKTKPGNSKAKLSKGWLYDIGGIYLEGSNLFETLMMNNMLHHPEKSKQYSLNTQRPCWESSPGQWVDMIMSQKPLNNLASLYTNWCRAVYVDPSWTEEKDVTAGIVKLAEIDKQDFFLEPMTLWKKPKKEQHYTPRVLKPEQALWRSFGLITQTNDEQGKKRPGIIDYLDTIKKSLPKGIISIRAVGMKSDENATSWLPKDEITDSLQMREILFDDTAVSGENWIVRINDTIEYAKNKIDVTYKRYLKEVAAIRDITNAEYINRNTERAYAAVDLPFRNWLISLKPDDSKSERIEEWHKILKNILLGEAQRIQGQTMPRDFSIREYKEIGKINLPIAYNKLCAGLNR